MLSILAGRSRGSAAQGIGGYGVAYALRAYATP